MPEPGAAGGALILDLGGVYFSDGTAAALEAIGARFSLPREAVHEALNGADGVAYRRGQIGADRFWERVRARLGIDADDAQLAALWHGAYTPQSGVVALVETLRARGVPVYYLSDNVPERVQWLEAHHRFLPRFSGGVFSFELGRVKPSPVLYRAVLERTGLPGCACVYVDDKEPLLAPARGLGMRGIHFRGAAALETGLRRLGLLGEARIRGTEDPTRPERRG